MNRSITNGGIRGLGLALWGLFSGCAVLTVDVDVYKGALVNEEEVQLHQLVALATAAKPMLIQLRDKLEWPHTDGMPVADSKSPEEKVCSKEDTVTDWYRPEYVSSSKGYMAEFESKSIFQKFGEWFSEFFTGPPASCQSHFESSYARDVNLILSLYEDLDSPDLVLYGRKLRQALERLRRAQLIFEFDEQRDRDIFATIATGLKSENELGRGLPALLQAYKDLLVPRKGEKSKPNRQVGQLMDALKNLSGSNAMSQKGLETELIKDWDKAKTYEKEDQLYDRRLPFRAVWKLLGEEEEHTLLAMVTRQLCVEGERGDDACRQLSKRTKELADAYWDSRQAGRELWEESLSLLVRIGRLEREQPNRYHALKEKLIRLAVKVTSMRQIASALQRLGEDGVCSALENVVVREWERKCEVKPSGIAWTQANVTDNPERFETIVKQGLSSAPTDTALSLLSLDSLEKYAAPKNSVAKTLVEKANRVNPKRVVRLGLNSSFLKMNGSDTESDTEDVFQVVEEVNRDLANGFGRGRLSDGLHTLTEKYLQLHNSATNGADLDDQKRLLDSLVEFAQKLLFLANHEGLASSSGTPGLLLGGGEKLSRGLFGDFITDKSIFNSGLIEEKKQQYVRVLQAVGNSILFSANELRERDRYRDLSEKRVPAEVAAVKAVYSPDPLKILNDLLNELRHEQDAAKGQLDEATAKKAAIEAQIGSATTPTTGLRDDEETAFKELNKAKQDLDDYRKALSQLKAIHDVLTQMVTDQIKTRWKAARTGDATDPVDFLTGPAGIDKQLTIIRQAQNGIPTPEEIHMFDETIKYVARADAKTAFEAYRMMNGQTSLKRVDLLEAFIMHLRQLDAERATRVTGLEKALDEKEQQHRDIQNEIARLTAETTQLATVIAELPNTKARLITAATVIEAMKKDVVKEAEQPNQFISPQAMYLLLASHVKRKEVAEPDASKQKLYQDTQHVLSSRTPPPGLPLLKDSDYKSPVEVMDTVIALLRHRAIEAAERYGQDSAESKRATHAVENAYQHRAGMLYIRPSSAYLRTSFPSTSLQDDPNLSWDNMLLKQGIRNLPFSSQLRDILDPSVKQDQALTSDLDKQHWQNINRVRVSGAGFTNQALVKDDVGNWYVKHYYGDTEKIAKSAKHLALFSLGTKLSIDLSHELQKASVSEEDAEKSKNMGPPLQRVFERHKGAYATYTADVSTKLNALHGKNEKNGLCASIAVAWDTIDEIKTDSDSHKALLVALDGEIQAWDTAAAMLKSPEQDRGRAIVKEIRALSRLEKMLAAHIQEIDKDADAKPGKERRALEKSLKGKEEDLKLTPDAHDKKQAVENAQQDVIREAQRMSTMKTKAKAEVRRIVGTLVLDMLRDRKQTLNNYEQAILFIGDASN